MSRAPAAARSGQDYQALFFWAKAAVFLLQPEGPISRVGFEVDDVDGFDDVVIERSRPDRDQFGRSIRRDYYQLKFHVDHDGDLTVNTLTDAREIGGTRYSLLERLKRASQRLGASVSETRFWLVSTYPIARDDLLRKLISTTEGGFRVQKLLSGGPSSTVGKLRAKWREHLELETDEELCELLHPLRVCAGAPHYKALQSELEFRLRALGFRAPGS